MLRNSLPQNVRRILRELPASLDETYERILREILQVNPEQVYRLLQCLTVSARPLDVDELAEFLALDFDAADDGIPVLNEGWRWDDKEQGILSTCSSLIVVIDGYHFGSPGSRARRPRIVQFAHFSVKEFLTSDRLSDIKADICRFHIRLEPAHTIISQSCLAILLQSAHDDGASSTSALYEYAAQHWVNHAHFGSVSLHIEYGMQRLFDPSKPYFTTWRNSCRLDIKWLSFLKQSFISWSPKSTSLDEDDAPLCMYYAALCGFRDLTRYLIAKNPQHVHATVGENKSPLAAALRNSHIQVAELLYQHGAALPIGYSGRTLLHAASADGLVDVAQWLLAIGTDANAREDGHRTPLYFAAAHGRLNIVHNVVDLTAGDDHEPLHGESSGGHADVMRLLIKNGADVHARDQRQLTPLHLASFKGDAETVQLLILHEADVNARDQSQSTPLHLASSWNNAEAAQLLIKHGADIHAQDRRQSTPLHLAASKWHAETAQVLIEHGADVHALDESQSTPLHLASSKDAETAWSTSGEYGEFTHPWNETVPLLIKHGADVNARDGSQSTPLHLASSNWGTEIAQQLIEHGADVHARDENLSTPLHLASCRNNAKTAQLLIKHGADVHARNKSQATPLFRTFMPETAQLLIEHGADVHARDQDQSTPLYYVFNSEIARVLIKHGADVHERNQDQSTPLHMTSSWPCLWDAETTARVLIEHGASVNAYDKNHQTPLHRVSSSWNHSVDYLRVLLENGADMDAEDDNGLTPFQVASTKGRSEIAQLLLDHRARIVSTNSR